MIKNQEKVIDYFGYWPEFCDAKFKKFAFNRVNHAGLIETTIFYIDADQSKRASINMKFSGVTSVKLNDLYSENVIDEILIKGSSPYTVTIEACYGLNGCFNCTDIEVTSVST